MSLIKKLKKELGIDDFFNSFAFIVFSLIYLGISIYNPHFFYKIISITKLPLIHFNVFTGMVFLIFMTLYNDRILNIIIKYNITKYESTGGIKNGRRKE